MLWPQNPRRIRAGPWTPGIEHGAIRRQPSPLSVTRAFVVQFRADTAVEQKHLAGRVEHVVSGQATDFESLETLLAFMARVLRAEGERAAEL